MYCPASIHGYTVCLHRANRWETPQHTPRIDRDRERLQDDTARAKQEAGRVRGRQVRKDGSEQLAGDGAEKAMEVVVHWLLQPCGEFARQWDKRHPSDVVDSRSGGTTDISRVIRRTLSQITSFPRARNISDARERKSSPSCRRLPIMFAFLSTR